jgi:hypothetical protein
MYQTGNYPKAKIDFEQGYAEICDTRGILQDAALDDPMLLKPNSTPC